jgi:hypothetical protein
VLMRFRFAGFDSLVAFDEIIGRFQIRWHLLADGLGSDGCWVWVFAGRASQLAVRNLSISETFESTSGY